MENYKEAIEHCLSLCPQLVQYLHSFVVPMPGDWPTCFFTKKIISQEENESSPLLSFIPEQGPFHVSLNMNEDVIKVYHFLFSDIYEKVFETQMPKKLKPLRAYVLLVAVYFGWLHIRQKVMEKFKICKDLEYVCILHILEEVVPMTLFHYPVLFRSGNLGNYIPLMARIAILFIIWERHHYDRATLSMISDLCHQKFNFPEYYRLKQNFLSLITEKKVEIWHSVLRSVVQPQNNGNEIRNAAISIAQSKSNKTFYQSFTRPYKRGLCDQDFRLISGKTAELLLELFKKIAGNIGKSKQIPRETNKKGTKYKGKASYHLHSFSTTVKSTALPLAYKSEDKRKPVDQSVLPDISKFCDSQLCNIQNQQHVQRMVCGHTYHAECCERCISCEAFLVKTAGTLSDAFNQTLLKKTKESSTTSTCTAQEETPSEDDSMNDINNQHDPEFYDSSEFQQQIDSVLDSFDVPQPEHFQQQQSASSTTCTTSTSSSQPQAQNNLRVQIALQRNNGFNLFYFPDYLSQSTLNNRQGSNACTFISLLLCKSFMANRNNLLFNPDVCTLPSSWFAQMALQIVKGNQIHDRVTGQQPINFSVTEAIPHVRKELGNVSVEESFDLEFCLQNPNVPHSSLAFYLQRLTQEPNVAAVVIINEQTVSFVGSGQGVIIMDSHKHGNYGALVGQSDIAHTEEFLIWLKSIISRQINLCTLTFIEFN